MRFVKKKKPIKTKICKKCGEEKLISEFYFRKENSTYRSECKKCFSETTRFFKCNKVPWRKHYYSARRRCNNNKASDYKWYGGRGIKCAWHSFEKFKDDMYESYKLHIKKFGEKDTTIDRIDNNGNYCKENCRWATFKIQQRNRRNNRLITFNDKTKCIAEWAVILNMRYGLLYQRIYRDKLTIQKAFTKKV